MSAFGGKADMAFCGANVCFRPKADIAVATHRHAFGLREAALGPLIRVLDRQARGKLRWPRQIHLRNSRSRRRTISWKRHRAASRILYTVAGVKSLYNLIVIFP